ncbi:MAG: glycosyltransferase family 1 protein [Symploca sp. SIO2E9]|nr:glycosyltransferase family 1 protein [Symploca sp. SIO2E9]
MVKTINPGLKRLKLVVLDANFYWTEQLFSACSDFADILLLRPLDFRAFRKGYGSYFIDFQPQAISEGVWEQRICCPPGWLFHYWPLTRRFFAYLIRKFQRDNYLIFVYSYPYYYSLVQELKASSIYYNIDDYRNYWPGRESQTPEVEKLAVNHADLTLCVAHYRASYLKQECRSKNSQIVHIPHGCSPEFMVEHSLSQPKSLPAELQAYSRPIAGYIGALTYRFDFDYLAKVAEKISDVTVILGGSLPQSSDGSVEWWQGVEAARRLPNVHFIGRVSHNRLGEYLQSFDVLLMPYSLCNFNRNACPTKLWDYMGTSLPVVANNVVPEVNQWSHLLLVSGNPEEFASNIRFALANRHWRSQERLDVAKAHTWKMQAQKLYHLLEKKGCLSCQSS